MPDVMPWYIPLVIFAARVGDVSIGTVRTIMMINGSRLGSAILGALEVTIWVLAVGGVLKYLPNPWAVLGYAAGFGTGVFVGMFTIAALGALTSGAIELIGRRVTGWLPRGEKHS